MFLFSLGVMLGILIGVGVMCFMRCSWTGVEIVKEDKDNGNKHQ